MCIVYSINCVNKLSVSVLIIIVLQKHSRFEKKSSFHNAEFNNNNNIMTFSAQLHTFK